MTLMKKIWCLAFLVFLTAGICSAKVPDLTGKWTGAWTGYDEGKGYSNLTETEPINLIVMEQMGRIFNGNLTTNFKNGTVIVEGFAGVIGLDNKTLNIAEFSKGYSSGTIVSNEEIELIYLADGKGGSVAIDELHRVEA
jgi:hypothetical protein